ncbi:hypothetical protein E8P77_02415 [Soehngenia saccharolytica]|nr:hypothetical protein E8P77_02415 [Soehngenia saccharolytica]
MKKRIISFALLLVIILAAMPLPSIAASATLPTTIYERVEETPLSSGATHQKIQRFTTSGWMQINVIKINLTDEYTQVKGMYNPEGLSLRDTVSNMVDKTGAIAGINGDYFNYNPVPNSLGTLINDSVMISSPIRSPYSLPTFYMDYNNNAFIDYIDQTMSAKNLRTGKTINISTYNKVSTDQTVVTLLDRNWGPKSLGGTYNKELVEVLVLNGIVSEKRVGGEPFNIPKEDNSYVLAVKNHLLNDLEVGDEIELSIVTKPDIFNIKTALGAGSIVLKDGVVTSTNIQSTGVHPRTGIGINKDNNVVYLVTVDGRHSSFKGIEQPMLGAILKDLGAYNGVNLDGGGSTTMALKPKGTSKPYLVNIPSEGSQRLVVNGLGVYSDAPIGELAYIQIIPKSSKMFAGGEVSFTVKGFDQYYNPIDIDKSQLVWSTSTADSYVENLVFRANSKGLVNITCDYNGIKGTADVEVLGEIKEIIPSVEKFNISPGNSKSLGSFVGKDDQGKTGALSLSNLSFEVIGGIGEVKDGVFYASNTNGSGAIVVKSQNAVASILVSVGSTPNIVNSFEKETNIKFAGYPNDVTGSVSLSGQAKDGSKSIALKYDMSKGTGTRVAYLNFTHTKNGYPLSGNPPKIGIWVKGDNSNTWLRGTIIDKAGKSYVIDFAKSIDFSDWKYLEASIPSGVSYPINLQRIYVAETNSANKPSGTILIDALTSYTQSPYMTNGYPNSTIVSDPLEKKVDATSGSKKISVYTEPKISGNTLMAKIIDTSRLKGLKNSLSTSNIGIRMGTMSSGFKNGINHSAIIDGTKSYGSSKNGDVYFITLRSTKEGIRAFDSSQWTKLMKDLNDRAENNIIITLPAVYTSFTDKLESELLHEKLSEAANKTGKRIFLVQVGNTSKAELKDGVRYITINDSSISTPEGLKNYSYVDFVFNGSTINYQLVFPFK